MRHRLSTVLLLGTLVLAGCSSSGGEPGAGGSSGDAGGTSSTTPSYDPATDPAAPALGACYDLGFEEAAQPTSSKKPVSCDGPHTTQTVFVGRLDTVVGGHSVSVDSRVAQKQVAEACPAHLAQHLGGSARTRGLSRFTVVWFGPTVAQSDRGATWFRCDVIALAGNEELAPLPPPARLKRVLDNPRSLETYGLCGTSDPGSQGFQRVICSRKHTWKAVSTIAIAGGEDYPGARAVRAAGEDACRDLVRRQTRDAEKFRYGWEWPSRTQWSAGQHHGYCWAPA